MSNETLNTQDEATRADRPRSETVLWAVKIGDEDWQEQLITSTTDADKLQKARAWATENGFDRLRVSSLDLTAKPDFAASLSPSEAAATLGRVRTRKKAKASRDNGRKGGRPRKVCICCRGELKDNTCVQCGMDQASPEAASIWKHKGQWETAKS